MDFLCHLQCLLLFIILFSLHDSITGFTTYNKTPASHITVKHWCFYGHLCFLNNCHILIQFSGLRYFRHLSDGYKGNLIHFQKLYFFLPKHYICAKLNIDQCFYIILTIFTVHIRRLKNPNYLYFSI